MTSRKSILDLIRFNLLDIRFKDTLQFNWTDKYYYGGTLFKKFLEQIILAEINGTQIKTPLYLGHFEFYEKGKNKLEIIDGKQRLFSVLIVLENLLETLHKEGELDQDRQVLFDSIQRNYSTKRSGYFNFESAHSITEKRFEKYSPKNLIRILNTIDQADFSQRISVDEMEKHLLRSHLVEYNSQPSKLKEFQANCYRYLTLGRDNYEEYVFNRFKVAFDFIENRFPAVNKYISEDQLFEMTLKCNQHFLNDENVEGLSNYLESACAHRLKYDLIDEMIKVLKALDTFINEDERRSLIIHEYLNFNNYKTTLPVILKAYMNGASFDQIVSMTGLFTKLVFKHEVIGVLNDLGLKLNAHFNLVSTQNNSFEHFNDKLHEMMRCREHPFMSHWGHLKLKKALDGEIHPKHAKYMLWIYENELRKEDEYKSESILFSDLQEFYAWNISEDDCLENKHGTLGNILLVKKTQLCIPKKEFYESLTLLQQQKEVLTFLDSGDKWTKDMIAERHNKIKDIIYHKFR